MTSKSESNWYLNYEALKAYILERGHLPDKHVVENRALLSWAKYVLQKNNGNVAFYYVDPSSPITTTSFRAYLELEDDASASRKRISLGNIEELLTSISTTSQDSHDNGIYNLRGEKVTSMLKGNVYVVNGKKIMVR